MLENKTSKQKADREIEPSIFHASDWRKTDNYGKLLQSFSSRDF